MKGLQDHLIKNPDTGRKPCLFCEREVPCECDGETCMCSCGRCAMPIPPLGLPGVSRFQSSAPAGPMDRPDFL